MTNTREAAKPTEAEIAPARQRLIDLKATMPMRDDLTCAMFAAWLGVSVDKLPGDFKQFDNPETMTAWRRVADAARAALSTPVADTRVVKPLDTCFDEIRAVVKAAEDERARYGDIAATIRINALHHGATSAEAEAMVKGETSFLSWILEIVDKRSATPAPSDKIAEAARLLLDVKGYWTMAPALDAMDELIEVGNDDPSALLAAALRALRDKPTIAGGGDE